MAEQKIELRKLRDFGENMNDTFLFIRQNFRPLIKSFLAICAVFMLTQAIFNGVYQSRIITLYRDFLGGRRNGVNFWDQIFRIDVLLIILSAMLTFVSMSVVLGAYMKFYAQNDGTPPSIDDIWSIFKRYFFKVLFYSIPVFLLIAFGSIFCFVPGIYLWVVLVPFSLVVIIEESNFGDSFSRCFELIRENFWTSFAIYLISWIIYNLCGLIIGGVVSAVMGLAGYLTTENLSKTNVYISSFLNIFSYSFYMIFFISAALNYFNLVEAKDGTGILNRIDNIGRKKNNFDNIEEEY
jgi:hypothetical protein